MISIWSLRLLRSARKWLKSERSLFLRKLPMCFKLRKVKITFYSFVSKHFWKELWFCKANIVLPISPVGPTFHCLYFSIRYYRCDRRGRTFSFSIVNKKGCRSSSFTVPFCRGNLFSFIHSTTFVLLRTLKACCAFSHGALSKNFNTLFCSTCSRLIVSSL